MNLLLDTHAFLWRLIIVHAKFSSLRIHISTYKLAIKVAVERANWSCLTHSSGTTSGRLAGLARPVTIICRS